MSYTITIKESKEVTKVENGEYKAVSHSYLSETDYEALSFADKKDWKHIEGNQYSKATYDYAPKIEKTSVVETTVFQQTVDTLDIKSVIQAVNTGPKADPRNYP